jgi:hypothetical protein
MMIDLTYGGIISIIIFLALMGLFATFFSKKLPRLTKSPTIGALTAGLPAGIICFPLWMLYMHPVHVIENDLQGHPYMLIGSKEYDMGNGKNEKVSWKWAQSQVVNLSNQTLIEEVVHYGRIDPDNNLKPVEIPPNSIGDVPKVDYYPEQIPPPQMELKESDAHRYFWLRVKKEDE